MEDCLCIQTIAKSVILPCDVYADGEYAAFIEGPVCSCFATLNRIAYRLNISCSSIEMKAVCVYPIVTLIILMCQFPEYLTAVCMESDIISP